MKSILCITLMILSTLSILEFIKCVKRKVKAKKRVTDEIYRCKNEYFTQKIIVGAWLGFWVYEEFLDSSIYRNISRGISPLKAFNGIDLLDKIVWVAIIGFCGVIFIGFIISIFGKARVYSEGIVFSSGEFVLWSEIKKVEYSPSIMKIDYIVSVYKDGDLKRKLQVRKEDIEKLLEIINENSSSEIFQVSLSME